MSYENVKGQELGWKNEWTHFEIAWESLASFERNKKKWGVTQDFFHSTVCDL